MVQLTISEASRLAKKSRTTLHRYIKDGKLSCLKDEQGNPKLDLSELCRVFPSVKLTGNEQLKGDKSGYDETSKKEFENQFLKEKIKHLEQLLKSKDEHIEDLRNSMLFIENKIKKSWWPWIK